MLDRDVPSPAGAASAGMEDLRQLLSGIREHLPVAKPLVYLDYPIHLNVGDLLIMQGTRKFFADYGYDVVGTASWMNFCRSTSSMISADTTIVFHGGGNFGDLYPDYQRFRESVILRFPYNKVVILPQTIWFGSKAASEASARIFRNHRDLTIFARDEPSYQRARDEFSDRVVMMPDMAHQLWDRNDSRGGPAARGTLFLMRRDQESSVISPAFVPQGVSPTDWRELIPAWRRRLGWVIVDAHKYEGMIGRHLGAWPAWSRYCGWLAQEMAAVFRQHDHIVTNRLHACILAALVGREVAFVDNSYGKLGGYFAAWLWNVPGITHKSIDLPV